MKFRNYERYRWENGLGITIRENLKFRLVEGYLVLRRLFLALGEKLRSRGVIETVDDIILF